MLIGMTIVVWSATGYTDPIGGSARWLDPEAKLAITFTSVAFALAVWYVVQTWSLYSVDLKEDDE